MSKEKKTLKNESSTPYDDAFKTMMAKSGNLRLAFINEMFHLKEPLKPDTQIENMATEYYIDDDGNGSQKKILNDSVFHINGKTYHIECQSLDDGTILVRMFEYDVAIGIRESEYSEYHLTVRMPQSGVFFLRRTSQTPEKMTVTIDTTGGSVDYNVDVLLLSDYSLDDLVEKNLLFLFPFYMFNLEKEFSKCEHGDAKSNEKVIGSMNELMEHVNDLFRSREINAHEYLLLTSMLRKVTDNLAKKYNKVRKELDDIMGGKVIEFEWEKSYKAYNEGKVNELVGLVHDKLLDIDVAEKRAKEAYGIDKKAFEQLLKDYTPEETLKQG